MRIALVGPTHPYKGGVAAHTTATAHHLAAAGHQVDLVSWSRLYPKSLYPGEQAVPPGGPDLPPYPATRRPLRWDRPATWWRTGRELAHYDLVVLVQVIPVQVPMLWVMARLARRRGGPPVLLIVHNVVPHERHPGGTWLVERLLRAADGVLVHSAEQARLAWEHGASRVASAALPPHLPGGDPTPGQREDLLRQRRHRLDAGDPVRLLALGLVRRYKGLDLLLEAARDVPGVRLTVAGEMWGEAGADVRRLAGEPGLAGRVRLVQGYLPGPRVPQLLAEHDVLALAYRHGTASQNVLLAHAHGLPVLASDVGTFADQVRDGVDGLLVPAGDPEALRTALRRLGEPGVVAAMLAQVPPADLDGPWTAYLQALTGLAR